MAAKSKGSSLVAWYNKVADFDVAKFFAKSHQPGPPRSVFVNAELPQDYYDPKGKVKKDHVYITNQVITSKYTVFTFLPRNLLEQFRRVANIFFAGIAILQFFPKFSTISPGLVILPLLVVLSITALKDGYEDIKRHQSDNHVNRSQTRVLAADGWTNPNAMTAKTKTFIRGVVPARLRRRAAKKKADQAQAGDADLEMAERGAPPEAIATERSIFDPVDVDGAEREFDDDNNVINPADSSRTGLSQNSGTNTVGRPHWKQTAWEDLRVGDIVKIANNESLPADILICATSEDENVAYVETKNLDGETNLKSRNAVPSLTYMQTAEACADRKNSFRVDCDKADNNMYKFNAAVIQGDKKSPVELQMILLRGTVVRNTEWVVGVVLFTGEDTKIMLNSGGTPSKRSKVERQMNPQVLINLLLLAIMATVCAIADSLLEEHYFKDGAPWEADANRSGDNPHINGLITFAFALITFQNIVPISLYISIEGVRTLQAAFIYFDKEIWYTKTDQPTLARTWNLSDDLGQIEYIFSDKTGTLTQNSMLFRQCSIAGRAYQGDPESDDETNVAPPKTSDSSTSPESGSSTTPVRESTSDVAGADEVKLSAGVLRHFKDAQLQHDIQRAHDEDSDVDPAFARSLNGFFTVLALCHTVLTATDPKTGAIEYKAQSPDEAALVQAAADMGFIFRGRDKEELSLQTPFAEQTERYELLNILEFTSARKRMSVIVRKLDDGDGRLFLLSKGADNVIFERLKAGDDELKKVTEKHLDEFANQGLRTLTLAYKVIPEDYYAEWSHRYHDATVSLDNREDQIEAISDEIEKELRLLGATAIEDRLQDGVPEAIADLKRAGIKVWVATGDKLETAIAIGYSTNLIGRDSNVIIVRGNSETDGKPVYDQMLKAVEDFFPDSDILQDEQVDLSKRRKSTERPRISTNTTGISEFVGADNGERPGGFVLVIDGAALTQAFADDQNSHLLLRLAMLCEGVICCRVSPRQKAQVVRLVKDGVGAMTLAIGDGANDVSMIQAADVGVGISGEEGLQAVNSSDYAIAQFRFLKRLLLVHGHWSYQRNGLMIVNFFYKNVVCIGVLWWFQIYCAWSAQYVFNYTYFLFWNSFWTVCPVIVMGLFDRVADDRVLMALPELYRYGREGHWFGTRLFLVYILDAIYQSAVIFFFLLYAYNSPTARSDGYDVYLYEFSSTMILSAVLTADLFVGLNTRVWTGWVFFGVLIGPVLLWLFQVIYQAITPGWIVTTVDGLNHMLYESAYFWFGLIFTVVIALAPRYIAKAIRGVFFSNDLDHLRYLRKYHPAEDVTAMVNSQDHALQHLKRSNTLSSSCANLGRPRPSADPRIGSRTDMSTGLRSMHRGFDFSTEENGIAMRRMQSNISERRRSQLSVAQGPREQRKLKASLLSIGRTIRRHHKSDVDRPSSS